MTGTLKISVLVGTAFAIGTLALSGLAASFTANMEQVAMDMARTLQFSPQAAVSMTTIPEDKSYMLSMKPIYKALQESLDPYVKGIRFHSFRGEENAILRSMILSGSTEYAPMRLYERQVDSLILTGSYYLLKDSRDKVNFSVTVINLQSQTLFQSEEYTISKSDCPPAIKRVVFSKLNNPNAFAECFYRGRVIKKLDNLFNSPNNNLLTYPAEYNFEKRHPYAIQWQVDHLREILSLKYAVSFSRFSKNRIILESSGAVVFIRDAIERQAQGLIDGEPLLPADFRDEYDSLHYLYPEPKGTEAVAHLEKKQYTTTAEKTVRDRIHETFDTYYPKLFTPLNYELLDRIFIDKEHPSILVGTKRVSDPRIGREVITYSWHTKKSWLKGLLRAYIQRQRTFDVQTEVMGVFHDNLDPHRYWAIVLQKWRTKDRHGSVVYQDDGFLIVNFDFNADQTLKIFNIHYRLWFYNYEYDDLELGITRREKVIGDLDRHFVAGVGGIDTELKNAMRDFIIGKIQKAPAGGTVKNTAITNDNQGAYAEYEIEVGRPLNPPKGDLNGNLSIINQYYKGRAQAHDLPPPSGDLGGVED